MMTSDPECAADSFAQSKAVENRALTLVGSDTPDSSIQGDSSIAKRMMIDIVLVHCGEGSMAWYITRCDG